MSEAPTQYPRTTVLEWLFAQGIPAVPLNAGATPNDPDAQKMSAIPNWHDITIEKSKNIWESGFYSDAGVAALSVTTSQGQFGIIDFDNDRFLDDVLWHFPTCPVVRGQTGAKVLLFIKAETPLEQQQLYFKDGVSDKPAVKFIFGREKYGAVWGAHPSGVQYQFIRNGPSVLIPVLSDADVCKRLVEFKNKYQLVLKAETSSDKACDNTGPTQKSELLVHGDMTALKGCLKLAKQYGLNVPAAGGLIICPFHADHSQSLSITERLAKCFSPSCKLSDGLSYRKFAAFLKSKKIFENPNQAPEEKRTNFEKYLDGIEGLAIFPDENNVMHIALPDMPGLAVPLNSEAVKGHLAALYFEQDRVGASPMLFEKAVTLLGKTKQTETRRKLWRRSRYTSNTKDSKTIHVLEYDLADDTHKHVIVSNDGRFLLEVPTEAHFRVAGYPQEGISNLEIWAPMPMAQARKQFDTLFTTSTNIRAEQPESTDPDIHIATVWLVAAFFPQFTHPLLALCGGKGGAKSSATTVFTQLVDPKEQPLMKLPSSPGDLYVNAEKNYLCSFDNLTNIDPDLSDTLCQFVVGTSGTKRKLYTDNDEVKAIYKPLIIINGLSNPAEKADLLDRTLEIDFQPFGQNVKRLSDVGFLARFNALRVETLRAIFSTIQATCCNIDDTMAELDNTPDLPRMAEFAIWGETISRNLGYPPNLFMTRYKKVIGRLSRLAVESSPIAEWLIKYLKEHAGRFNDTASELLAALERMENPEGIPKRKGPFPVATHTFTRKLNECKQDLELMGILMDSQHTKTGRRLRIYERVDIEASDTIESTLEHRKDELCRCCGNWEATIVGTLTGTREKAQLVCSICADCLKKWRGLQEPPPQVATLNTTPTP